MKNINKLLLLLPCLLAASCKNNNNNNNNNNPPSDEPNEVETEKFDLAFLLDDNYEVKDAVGFTLDENGYALVEKGTQIKFKIDVKEGAKLSKEGLIVKVNDKTFGEQVCGPHTYCYLVKMDTSKDEYTFVLGQDGGDDKGRIISCYSSGFVNYDGTKSKTYLFGPGECFGCYSICKMKDGNDIDVSSKAILRYAFDESNKDNHCWYDEVACEYLLNTTTFAKKYTNNIAIDYGDNKTNFENQILDLGYNNKIYNYGYPTFKFASYMQNKTGDGSKDNPYQIVNLRKLYQLSGDNNDKYYVLTQDMNGAYVTDTENGVLAWESIDIKNIQSLNGVDGIHTNTHEISNIIVDADAGGGVFNVVTDCNISNIKILDIVPDMKGTYIGSLINKLDGTAEKGSSVNNCIVAFKSQNTITISQSNTYYGFLIGQMTENTKLNNCNLTVQIKDASSFILDISSDDDTSSIGTIGVYVGKMSGGTISNCNMSSAIDIEFFSGNKVVDNAIITIGGIVGEQEGGEISKCGATKAIKVFNNNDPIYNEGEIEYKSNKLYVGGIVGQNTSTDGKGEISECYTTQIMSIAAGNNYLFEETYAAGICAKGGNILNCANRGNIEAYARKYYKNYKAGDYDQNEISFETTKEDLENDKSECVYTNYNHSGNIDKPNRIFSHLVFAKIKETAHSAGIANEYKSVKNKSDIVSFTYDRFYEEICSIWHFQIWYV